MSGWPRSPISRSAISRAGHRTGTTPPSSRASVTAPSTWAPPAEVERPETPTTMNRMDEVRLDKWLWAARFYKTRSLAVEEIGKGRVDVNGQPAKPARSLRVDDQ